MVSKNPKTTNNQLLASIRIGTAMSLLSLSWGCHSAGGNFRSSQPITAMEVAETIVQPETGKVVGHLKKRGTAPETAASQTTVADRVVVSGKREVAVSTADGAKRGAEKTTDSNLQSATLSPVSSRGIAVSTAMSTTKPTDVGPSVGLENSLPSFEQTALANHPGLQELQERITALEGKWLQVGLRPNTHLGFSGQQLYSGGEAEQIGLFVGQQVVRQPKLDWNRQVVCHELEVARQQWEIQRQRVLTDVRQNYYQVLVAQERVAILERLAEIANQAVTAAESLQRAGEGTQIDILRATVEQQATQVELTNARTSLSARWQQLNAVLGAPQSTAVVLTGDLTASLTEIDSEVYWGQLQQQSPELLSVLAERERAQASWQRARVEAQPDVDIESVVQYDQSTGGTNANLQVSMPLPWRDWNQGGIQQTRSEWLAAEQSVHKVELGLQQRLAMVFQDYENARQQIQAYRAEDGMIANSQKSLQLIDAAYRAGEIGFLDLITAQRTNAQTNLLYLTSLESYWNAYWELEGMLLKGSLQ